MPDSSTNSADLLNQFRSPLEVGSGSNILPSDPLRTSLDLPSFGDRSSFVSITQPEGLMPPGNFDFPSGFNSGYFTVGTSGQVGVDYLFDGGSYQGELGIFSLAGLEQFDPGSNAFIQEVVRRILSSTTQGHLVIDDHAAAARFTDDTGWEGNFNSGDYLGVKTVAMNPGDTFGVALLPNGSFRQILGNTDLWGNQRPLFSLATANPNQAFQFGQIADVTGNGSTFVLEDLSLDGYSDRDYNDVIFQVRGAIGVAASLDEVIAKDWRGSDFGQALLSYIAPYDASSTTQPIDYHFPTANQPLIGIIDTGFAANNPDIDYSRITLGRDYVDGDINPLLNAGEGNEHGTHILGIIGATQNNGIGIDGINDQAPLWLGRAIGSGQWATSLFEFVNVAKTSGQPNAIANLSFDLTQINPDGGLTTRKNLNSVERAALEYAKQNNVLVVVSSGNQGGEMSALAKASLEFDNVLTVGAANENLNSQHDHSSFGAGLDLLASGQKGADSGTSSAAAIVSGAISQLWAANPALSYQQVKEIIKATATDLRQPGWDAETGAGLLNPTAALQVAKQTTPAAKTTLPSQDGGSDLATPVLGSTEQDDSIIYTATSDGQIIRLNTQTGETVQVYQGRAFTDIALAPNGKLYGSTFNQLFEIDLTTGKEKLVGSFPSSVSLNALTFAPDGRLFGADSKTGKLYLVLPETAQTIEFANLGSPSSGDIVFNGRNEILATVKGGNGDRLVAVDVSTGKTRTIGDLGFQNVYGLALVGGVLNAFTDNGQKLEIDPRTGATTVVGSVSTGNGHLWGVADNPSNSAILIGGLPVVLPEGQADPTAPSIDMERPTDLLSKIRASAMGGDWRTEYDRTEAWIGNITSLIPTFWNRDQQGRNWDIVYTTQGFIIRTPGLGAFSFSWEEYNKTKSWNLFWNAVSAGLSRNQIIAFKDAYWTHRQHSTSIIGPLRYRESSDGRGWVQEFDGPDGRRFLMLENGASQAFLVHGDNYREYMALGGPEGRLGFPRNNEQYIQRADGRHATWQQFSSSGGKSRIHHLGRSVATWGLIGELYTNIGGAGSFLGMPTRHEYVDGDTIWSDFEGGRIAYKRNTGETVALKYGELPSWRRVAASLKRFGELSSTEKQQVEAGFPFPNSYGSRYAQISTSNAPKRWSSNAGQKARYIQDGDMPVVADSRYRSADQIRQAISYFNVADPKNGRYARIGNETYCNIFAGDVMRSLRAPLPHWRGTGELDANATFDWLSNSANGWRKVTSSEAANASGKGIPAVASWKIPGGIGHIAVVRPPETGDDPNNPRIAQAGRNNYENTTVSKGFGTTGGVGYFIYG